MRPVSIRVRCRFLRSSESRVEPKRLSFKPQKPSVVGIMQSQSEARMDAELAQVRPPGSPGSFGFFGSPGSPGIPSLAFFDPPQLQWPE